MGRRLVVPNDIKALAYAFHVRGYTFYLVGGWVRDSLFNKPSADIDATTNARPEVIKEILNAHGVKNLWTVGEKFGTIGAQVGHLDVEVTTYRTEFYEDGNRRPYVEFGGDLVEDLGRRDFTFNALACDPDSGEVIDYFGGLKDYYQGRVRAVGNPVDRMNEDPLRMLRAVRFAGQLHYSLDQDLYDVIKYDAFKIRGISWERIRDELTKIILVEDPTHGLDLLQRTGLMHYILPEVDDLVGVQQVGAHHYADAYEHTMLVVKYTPPELILRLAALYHDTGKFDTADYSGPATTFYGHEDESARHAHSAMSRLRYPTKVVEAVTHLCARHMHPNALLRDIRNGKVSRKAVRRLMRKSYKRLTPTEDVNINDLMVLNYADLAAHKDPDMGAYDMLLDMIEQEYIDANNHGTVPEDMTSPLDGNEIMAACNALNPGPWVGKTKEHLTNLVVDGIIEVGDKDAAVKEARKYWNIK